MAAINGPQPTNYVHGPQSLRGPHSARGAQGAQPASLTPADQLDISPAAAQAADADDSSGEVRADLVAQLRSQIADGSYETVDKVAGAVDRLLDEIG